MVVPTAPKKNSSGSEPPKVPKTVEKARKALADARQAITAENLKATLGPKEYNNLANQFRAKLPQNRKEEYNSMANKSEWIAQWVLDPQTSMLQGFNAHSAHIVCNNQHREQWLTREQLESPQWLHSKARVGMLIDHEETVSRLHEVPALASHGVLQYKFDTSFIEKIQGTKVEIGIEAKADIKPEEYDQIKTSIEKAAVDQNTKRTTPKKEMKPEDPNVKLLRGAVSKHATACRNTKRIIDNSSTAMKDRQDKLDAIVKNKGYPVEMKNYLEGK